MFHKMCLISKKQQPHQEHIYLHNCILTCFLLFLILLPWSFVLAALQLRLQPTFQCLFSLLTMTWMRGKSTTFDYLESAYCIQRKPNFFSYSQYFKGIDQPKCAMFQIYDSAPHPPQVSLPTGTALPHLNMLLPLAHI